MPLFLAGNLNEIDHGTFCRFTIARRPKSAPYSIGTDKHADSGGAVKPEVFSCRRHQFKLGSRAAGTLPEVSDDCLLPPTAAIGLHLSIQLMPLREVLATNTGQEFRYRVSPQRLGHRILPRQSTGILRG